MKVLTGEIAPTNGFVSLGGYDLARECGKARRVVGYCPQFDALHDLLTVREQLELYARLKGIPKELVKQAVDEKIDQVGLTEYQTKLTQGLSSGNKRKLSTAIALIGSPRIIILDEPSTGVDPSSRRKMWDVIASVCAAKESSVILTTHSMVECEAFCTRVGILVSGKLKCLGSVEHLKQKFGRGYIVEVKLQDPDALSVRAMAQQVTQLLGTNSVGISRERLESVCASLGTASRAQEIMDGENSGTVLSTYLETSGIITIDVVCVWWHTEEMGTALQVFFFHSKFPGTVYLVDEIVARAMSIVLIVVIECLSVDKQTERHESTMPRIPALPVLEPIPSMFSATNATFSSQRDTKRVKIVINMKTRPWERLGAATHGFDLKKWGLPTLLVMFRFHSNMNQSM